MLHVRILDDFLESQLLVVFVDIGIISAIFSVATPRVFSIDLGFFDPTLGSRVFSRGPRAFSGFFQTT